MRSKKNYSCLALLLVAPIVSAQWAFPADDECSMPNNQMGKCVNIKSCPALLSLIEAKPPTPEKIDFLTKSVCEYDGNNTKVCCEYSDQREETLAPTQEPSTDLNPAPDVRNHPNLRLLDSNCGPINRDKIIGGTVAGINEFPWLALLAYDVGKYDWDFLCGGSIINKRYILTAAHCVTDLPSNLRLYGVRVGEHDMLHGYDCSGSLTNKTCNGYHQDIKIEEMRFHPEYSRTSLHHDVALIRLSRDIDFRPDNVRPICMPIGSAATFNNQKMTVAGWSVSEQRLASTVLLKVSLSHFPQDECAKVYRSQTKIWHKQMCIGDEQGKNSCYSDPGGPLQAPAVYNGTARYVQYGIASFGFKNCGTQGHPGVYTRVDYYLEWVLDNIRE